MHAIADPPVALVANPTSAEAALIEAFRARGQEAVDAAEQAAISLSMRVERLQGVIGTENRVGELRPAMIEQHQAAHRWHYLQAFSVGEVPEALPTKLAGLDADLVARVGRARPHQVAQLIGKAEAQAAAAAQKADAITSRMEAFKAQYQSADWGLEQFTEAYTRERAEQSKLREQSNRLRKAAETSQAALRRDIGGALGNLTDLRIGLRECVALGRREDDLLNQMVHELETIDGDLARLGLGFDDDQGEVEPGPIAAELSRRRSELAEQIKSCKREAIASTGTSATELVDRASEGDPVALTRLIGVVRSRPLAFRPALDSDVIETMADALSSAADVFASLIE